VRRNRVRPDPDPDQRRAVRRTESQKQYQDQLSDSFHRLVSIWFSGHSTEVVGVSVVEPPWEASSVMQ
jgi:hypothetical protein